MLVVAFFGFLFHDLANKGMEIKELILIFKLKIQ